MKIIILGATGQIGAQLTTEALSRGHHVTGVARAAGKLPAHPRLTAVSANISDDLTLPPLLAGHDAVFVSIHFTDLDATRLLAAVQQSGVARLLVVGGAGSLEVAPGQRLVDQPNFPAAYRTEALAGAEFLRVLRQDPAVNWTFVSPSAWIHAGERTGKFRLGRDQLLADAKGESHISIPDFAIAFLDEADQPKHPRARFTVGY